MSSADAEPPEPAAAAPDAQQPPPALTPEQRFRLEPARFGLDQAVAVIAPHVDPASVDFRTTTRMGSPGAEVLPVKGANDALVTPTFGLLGPGGVLPRHYTASAHAQSRSGSTALHEFFDLLSRRFTGLFVKAGAKYKPTRNPRQAEQILSAAAGLATPHITDSLVTPLQALLFHAGSLSARNRSAERLRGMLSEETGSDVGIIEFVGGWSRLPAGEQTQLFARGRPGRYAQVGVDAALGSQFWDASALFLVSFGPLSLSDFQALLPGEPLHTRLAELVRLHVGMEERFAFNPVLAADQVPPLRLLPKARETGGGARLGWTSWLTSPKPRRQPAADAMLRPVVRPITRNDA